MATNDFQPFAYGGAANVVSQSAYLALTTILQNGFSSGVAQSAQLNKVWRQSSIMAAVLAQFSSDYSGQNSTDDGTTATLETNLIAAIRGVTKTGVLLTDTGTANAYTASNVPALTSGQLVNGLVQQVVIAHANTGASTYAPDGLTAYPIYGLGLQALQGGELYAGGTAVLMRATIAGINSGNPIWLLMECAGGAQQIAPATQSQHAVQLGQLENTSSPLPLATAPASLAAHAVPFSQIPVVVGSMRNAKMVVTAASSSATFTADEIMVESALGGLAYRMAVYSKTINLATTGAGGMDTGSPPSNGWVALYAILNPSTSTASILATNCTSATAPNIYGGANMPAGYTASALIGVWSTNASGQFNIGVQRDRMRSFPPVAVLTTSTSAGSYTTLNTGTIPLNAISAQFTLFMNNTANSSMSINIASDSSGSGQQSNGGLVTANDALQNNASILIATPQTLYYSSASGAGTPTYQITVFGFSF